MTFKVRKMENRFHFTFESGDLLAAFLSSSWGQQFTADYSATSEGEKELLVADTAHRDWEDSLEIVLTQIISVLTNADKKRATYHWGHHAPESLLTLIHDKDMKLVVMLTEVWDRTGTKVDFKSIRRG
jgi:hypothetical protein